jgi:hypothetical protein
LTFDPILPADMSSSQQPPADVEMERDDEAVDAPAPVNKNKRFRKEKRAYRDSLRSSGSLLARTDSLPLVWILWVP